MIGRMLSDMSGALLICRVGSVRLAIDSSLVRELLPMLPLWRPPTLPAPLAGFVSVRGEILPVLAPAILLGQSEALGTVEGFSHIIRPHDASAARPCLLVDRVEDLVRPGTYTVAEVAPEASLNGTIIAELGLEDGIAHLISLDALLDKAERAQLAALTEAARRRAGQWAGAA
jgi:purine-binding chemotaxis protein CheW